MIPYEEKEIWMALQKVLDRFLSYISSVDELLEISEYGGRRKASQT
ncbi:MAG: hypothetical protein IMF10_06615 [Proteobacteria bacterium]|nr:hypothetical protein [Pseudomonadota bacterium]